MQRRPSARYTSEIMYVGHAQRFSTVNPRREIWAIMYAIHRKRGPLVDAIVGLPESRCTPLPFGELGLFGLPVERHGSKFIWRDTVTTRRLTQHGRLPRCMIRFCILGKVLRTYLCCQCLPVLRPSYIVPNTSRNQGRDLAAVDTRK